jgi:glycosyltransferase involved in cell wall biosynthesis
MRIAIVVDAYAPARTSAAVQIHDLAKELVARGHEPTVIVPSATLGSAWSLDRVDGVEVLRLRAFRTKDITHVQRAAAELLLSFVMLRNLGRSPARAVRWEGIVWYSPTIFFGPLVAQLKRRYRCRSYLILRDLFPDWAVDAGVMGRGLAYRVLKLVERYQYLAADVIGVQTPANLVHLDRYSGPERRIEVLHNWLSEAPIGASVVALGSGPLSGRIVFVYAGNMGVAQGMDCLIELACRLRGRTDIGFLFVGRGSEVPRLRGLVEAMALDNVVFHDEIEPWEVPGLLARCHVGLLTLDPRHRTHNVPGKFLTYLRAGLPVLARVNAGNDLESLIDRRGVGCVCVGNAIDRLQQYAEELATDADVRKQMGARGRVLADEMFSVATAATQVIAGLKARPDRGRSRAHRAAPATGARRVLRGASRDDERRRTSRRLRGRARAPARVA